MKKTEARKLYKEKRKLLSTREVNRMQDLLLIRFQEINLPYAHILHSYLPVYANNEPDPSPLIDWMRFRDLGLKIAYPKIDSSDTSMQHFLQDEHTEFEVNQYGIPEPVGGTTIEPGDIDIVFVPLLAFDESGNRVGYGKGYYDRFLAKCRKNSISIGLSFFPPVESIEDVDFFDKKIDFCITPERVYAF